ncbi:hypothetical protein GE21DRAFT_3644 [Neurospora crassa]|uniref:Uncharacterized protein n=1 Tax=Neurospora crassa (strain ATCC 24698 / 74-OR23-1A / CBS 708.71 / DSM 1257 / FGSC 987) TaxID=367110 RepID=V5INK0_NEUCR|nr:hypothetical protein NCU16589 [Neurospora crassa OR74A]ESA43713.1 hypothetical protein NCU16589 [Neurospora crassa OR74A]KHE82401.1 hypothetical protein GE21DRAFT_3644 [Neurospora crassa]|eukprot:XP_011393710.1 hypothetical protein NCU16589 [Neurospora crassa OR74A]
MLRMMMTMPRSHRLGSLLTDILSAASYQTSATKHTDHAVKIRTKFGSETEDWGLEIITSCLLSCNRRYYNPPQEYTGWQGKMATQSSLQGKAPRPVALAYFFSSSSSFFFCFFFFLLWFYRLTSCVRFDVQNRACPV